MSTSDWLELVRLHWKKEEGQTMAEYGVVLAVITIGAVAVFTEWKSIYVDYSGKLQRAQIDTIEDPAP